MNPQGEKIVDGLYDTKIDTVLNLDVLKKDNSNFSINIEPTLNSLKNIKDPTIQKSVLEILNLFSEKSTEEEIKDYLKKLDIILIKMEAGEQIASTASAVETSKLQADLTSDSEGFKIPSLDGNGYIGENMISGVVGTATGVVDKYIKEPIEAGVDAYNYEVDKHQAEIDKKNRELLAEIEKISLKGKIPEDFEEDINKFFEDKYPGIKDSEKVERSDELKRILNLKNSIIESYKQKDKILEDLNKQINEMYDPESNIITFKDENGTEQTIEFRTPEEAGKFILEFKRYTEEELNSMFSFSVSGSILENLLFLTPYDNYKNIQREGLNFWDVMVGSTQLWLLGALGVFIATGFGENISRGAKDLAGGFGFNNYEEYARRDNSIEMTEEQKEMVNRNEVVNDMKSMLTGLSEPQRSKALAELDLIDNKYRRIKTSTFYLKIYKLNLYYLEEGNPLIKRIKYYAVSFSQGGKYLYALKPIQWGLNGGAKLLKTEKRFTFADEKIKNHERHAYKIYNKSRMLEIKNSFLNFFELQDDNKSYKGFKPSGFAEEKLKSGDKLKKVEIYIDGVFNEYGITNEDHKKAIKDQIEKYLNDLKEFGGIATEQSIKMRTAEIVYSVQLDLNKSSDDYNRILNDLLNSDSKLKDIFDNQDGFGKGKIKKNLRLIENAVKGGYFLGTEADLRAKILDALNGKKIKIESPQTIINRNLGPGDSMTIISKDISKIISDGKDILNAKNEFKEFLNDDKNNKAINNYIEYLVEQSLEKDKKKALEDLAKSDLTSSKDYYDELARIMDIPSSGLTEDEIKKELTDKIGGIADLSKYDVKTEIGNPSIKEFEKKFGIDDDVKAEFVKKRIDYEGKIKPELEKFLQTVHGAANLQHGYTNGQATEILQKIFNGDTFEDSIRTITSVTSHVDLEYPTQLKDIISELKAVKIIANLDRVISEIDGASDLDKLQEEFKNEKKVISDVTKEPYKSKIDEFNTKINARREEIKKANKQIIIDRIDSFTEELKATPLEDLKIKLKEFNDFLSDKSIKKTDTDYESKINEFILEYKNQLNLKIEAKLNSFILRLESINKISRLNKLLEQFEDFKNAYGLDSTNPLVNKFETEFDKKESDLESKKASSSPDTGKDIISKEEKVERINDIFDRIEMQLILEGRTYDKIEFRKLHNKYLSGKKFKEPINGIERQIYNEYGLSLKTEGELLIVLENFNKAKKIVDEVGSSIDFKIGTDFKTTIRDFNLKNLRIS